MICLRKVRSNHHSRTSLNIQIPRPVSRQIGICPGDDLMFEFQPNSKEIVLIKSPYDRMSVPHPWTKEEIELLKNLCIGGITKSVADRFGRSVDAVERQVRKYGFKFRKAIVFKRWPNEDKKLLMELYSNTSNRELAEKLGRSIVAIKKEARYLGLFKSK